MSTNEPIEIFREVLEASGLRMNDTGTHVVDASGIGVADWPLRRRVLAVEAETIDLREITGVVSGLRCQELTDCEGAIEGRDILRPVHERGARRPMQQRRTRVPIGESGGRSRRLNARLIARRRQHEPPPSESSAGVRGSGATAWLAPLGAARLPPARPLRWPRATWCRPVRAWSRGHPARVIVVRRGATPAPVRQ